jgi:hypothetical protein
MLAGLRLLVVMLVLALLARAARLAWRNRRLAILLWRRIRPRHVLGSLGLIVVVLTTVAILLEAVPITRFGLGSLLGLSGNAVFAPLEELLARGGGGAPGLDGGAGPAVAQAGGTLSPWVIGATGGFLAGLLALIPWLAYVEERVFREGLERTGALGEVMAALKFGLAHMIMLIPIAAALAIAVAGFAYGRAYRRAFARTAARTIAVPGPLGVPVEVRMPAPKARHAAVLESTTWHVTFNSLVVLLVLAGILTQWASAG